MRSCKSLSILFTLKGTHQAIGLGHLSHVGKFLSEWFALIYASNDSVCASPFLHPLPTPEILRLQDLSADPRGGKWYCLIFPSIL